MNFRQERDFQANETFLQKIQKGAPKMAGDREKKMAIDQKMGGDCQECIGKISEPKPLPKFWLWPGPIKIYYILA